MLPKSAEQRLEAVTFQGCGDTSEQRYGLFVPDLFVAIVPRYGTEDTWREGVHSLQLHEPPCAGRSIFNQKEAYA